MTDKKIEIRLDEIGELRNDIVDTSQTIEMVMESLEELDTFKDGNDYECVMYSLKTIQKRLEDGGPKTDEMYYEGYLGFRNKVVKGEPTNDKRKNDKTTSK